MDGTQLMQKVAEVAPEKYDFIMRTREEVSESPFRDEILGDFDGIIKQAAFAAGTAMKSFGKSVGGGALSVGKGVALTAMSGIGLALAGDAYDAIRRGITKTRNYKGMLASNPDLKDKPAHQVQAIFSTLHRFNPDFASDPVVSGSFVRQHVELAQGEEGSGAVGLDALKSLVDARKGLTESRRIQAPKMFELEDKELARLQKGKLQAETWKAHSDVKGKIPAFPQ